MNSLNLHTEYAKPQEDKVLIYNMFKLWGLLDFSNCRGDTESISFLLFIFTFCCEFLSLSLFLKNGCMSAEFHFFISELKVSASDLIKCKYRKNPDRCDLRRAGWCKKILSVIESTSPSFKSDDQCFNNLITSCRAGPLNTLLIFSWLHQRDFFACVPAVFTSSSIIGHKPSGLMFPQWAGLYDLSLHLSLQCVRNWFTDVQVDSGRS